jgi:hypothetical protein
MEVCGIFEAEALVEGKAVGDVFQNMFFIFVEIERIEDPCEVC